MTIYDYSLKRMTIYDYSLTRQLPTTQNKLEPVFIDSISPGCTNIINIIGLVIIVTFSRVRKTMFHLKVGIVRPPTHLSTSSSHALSILTELLHLQPSASSRYWETLIDKVHSLNATKSSSHSFPDVLVQSIQSIHICMGNFAEETFDGLVSEQIAVSY